MREGCKRLTSIMMPTTAVPGKGWDRFTGNVEMFIQQARESVKKGGALVIHLSFVPVQGADPVTHHKAVLWDTACCDETWNALAFESGQFLSNTRERLFTGGALIVDLIAIPKAPMLELPRNNSD